MPPEDRIIVRYRDLPSLPVLPDQDLGIRLIVVEQPFLVQSLRIGFPLYPDAAVAGFGPQLRFRHGIDPAPVARNVRYFVQQVPVVKPQGSGAVHIIRIKPADPAHQQEFPGTGLVIGLFPVDQPCGNQQCREQFPVPEHIQPLGQLVHHQPERLIRDDLFQELRRHISLYQDVPVQDRGIMKR